VEQSCSFRAVCTKKTEEEEEEEEEVVVKFSEIQINIKAAAELTSTKMQNLFLLCDNI